MSYKETNVVEKGMFHGLGFQILWLSKKIKEMCSVSLLGKVIKRMNFHIILDQTTMRKA
jgi:hypothetical protein